MSRNIHNSERPWICFFSQSGTEIVELAEKLGRWPDVVVTNDRPSHLRTIHPKIEDSRYIILPNKPSLEDYEELLDYFDNPIITLHGWLRVMGRILNCVLLREVMRRPDAYFIE